MFNKREHKPEHSEGWAPRQGKARVLIEDPDGASQWAAAKVLRAAGYDVATCYGPDPRHHVDCPLVKDGQCSLAQEADVVLCELDHSDTGKEVLFALAEETHAEIVRTETSIQARSEPHIEGVMRLRFPPTSTQLVDAVDSALESRARS